MCGQNKIKKINLTDLFFPISNFIPEKSASKEKTPPQLNQKYDTIVFMQIKTQKHTAWFAFILWKCCWDVGLTATIFGYYETELMPTLNTCFRTNMQLSLTKRLSVIMLLQSKRMPKMASHTSV